MIVAAPQDLSAHAASMRLRLLVRLPSYQQATRAHVKQVSAVPLLVFVGVRTRVFVCRLDVCMSHISRLPTASHSHIHIIIIIIIIIITRLSCTGSRCATKDSDSYRHSSSGPRHAHKAR